jgi:hypothetical protein
MADFVEKFAIHKLFKLKKNIFLPYKDSSGHERAYIFWWTESAAAKILARTFFGVLYQLCRVWLQNFSDILGTFLVRGRYYYYRFDILDNLCD